MKYTAFSFGQYDYVWLLKQLVAKPASRERKIGRECPLNIWMAPYVWTPPICLDVLLYFWMPPFVWKTLICLDAPCMFGHPNMLEAPISGCPQYVWTPPCVCMPCMFGHPHMIGHPICLDAPIYLDGPIQFDTPICLDAPCICMPPTNRKHSQKKYVQQPNQDPRS